MRSRIVALMLVVLCASCGQKPPQEQGGQGGEPRKTDVVASERTADAWSHEILEHTVPSVMEADSTTLFTVTVRNTSNRTWSAGGPIKVGCYWTARDGTHIGKPEGRGMHKTDIYPGSAATVNIRVKAPATPGEYLLVLDVVEEHVAWFGNKGATPVKVPVEVR